MHYKLRLQGSYQYQMHETTQLGNLHSKITGAEQPKQYSNTPKSMGTHVSLSVTIWTLTTLFWTQKTPNTACPQDHGQQRQGSTRTVAGQGRGGEIACAKIAESANLRREFADSATFVITDVRSHVSPNQHYTTYLPCSGTRCIYTRVCYMFESSMAGVREDNSSSASMRLLVASSLVAECGYHILDSL